MIQETIDMLGLRAKDKVTGLSGVVSSVSFDLYGCVCCALSPGVTEAKLPDSYWFDIHRLEILDGDRVMEVPDFAAVPRLSKKEKPAEVPQYSHGAADKPSPR